jgi:hypothetical protein
MLRALVLAGGLAGLLAAPSAAQAQPPAVGHAGMIGGWHGVGMQVGPGGVQSTWDITLRIRADITSRIEYPSLGCKGTLHEEKRSATEIEFREQIDTGLCIDGGKLTVRLVDNRVWWFWRGQDGTVDASAVLYRDAFLG